MFASTQTGGGQNGGRTAYVADDTVGNGAFAFRLTSAGDVELRRDATGATAEVAFFVVSWGLP